jgi:uncharacterized protein YqiB (DUF1249 family)
MSQDSKKTHTEVKQPQISIPRLADYMAASEQGKRTIAQSCKYRSTVRVTQHNEAKAVWPAPGSADTELGVLMEPEVCHGSTEVYTGVQA